MTAAKNASQGNKRVKGPRPKHVPQRMCIACRERSSKRTFTRIVRRPEGPVEIDPGGKLNGRGAYLCDRPACWERAIGTNLLAHALKTELNAETAASLRRYAADLPETGEEPAVAEEGQEL